MVAAAPSGALEVLERMREAAIRLSALADGRPASTGYRHCFRINAWPPLVVLAGLEAVAVLGNLTS